MKSNSSGSESSSGRNSNSCSFLSSSRSARRSSSRSRAAKASGSISKLALRIDRPRRRCQTPARPREPSNSASCGGAWFDDRCRARGLEFGARARARAQSRARRIRARNAANSGDSPIAGPGGLAGGPDRGRRSRRSPRVAMDWRTASVVNDRSASRRAV